MVLDSLLAGVMLFSSFAARTPNVQPNPDDYEVTGIKPRTGDFDITGGPYYPENEGIMQVAELGLPQPMDWQNERLSLDELIDLGASQEQIAQYLGVV